MCAAGTNVVTVAMIEGMRRVANVTGEAVQALLMVEGLARRVEVPAYPRAGILAREQPTDCPGAGLDRLVRSTHRTTGENSPASTGEHSRLRDIGPVATAGRIVDATEG